MASRKHAFVEDSYDLHALVEDSIVDDVASLRASPVPRFEMVAWNTALRVSSNPPHASVVLGQVTNPLFVAPLFARVLGDLDEISFRRLRDREPGHVQRFLRGAVSARSFSRL